MYIDLGFISMHTVQTLSTASWKLNPWSNVCTYKIQSNNLNGQLCRYFSSLNCWFWCTSKWFLDYSIHFLFLLILYDSCVLRLFQIMNEVYIRIRYWFPTCNHIYNHWYTFNTILVCIINEDIFNRFYSFSQCYFPVHHHHNFIYAYINHMYCIVFVINVWNIV